MFFMLNIDNANFRGFDLACLGVDDPFSEVGDLDEQDLHAFTSDSHSYLPGRELTHRPRYWNECDFTWLFLRLFRQDNGCECKYKINMNTDNYTPNVLFPNIVGGLALWHGIKPYEGDIIYMPRAQELRRYTEWLSDIE